MASRINVKNVLVTMLVVLAVGGAVAAVPALASKGGHNSPTTPSIALNQTDPHLGEQVTFTVVYPSTVKYPGINVMCYQGSTKVYGEGGFVGDTFTLGAGSLWQQVGGPASCVAQLYSIDRNAVETVLASTSFDAAG